jgi:uncharacterized protein YjbI with pentapeptide repeats
LVHVALLLTLAVVVAGGTGFLLWMAVGRPSLHGAVPGWTVGNSFDAMKIVLAVVGGIGGVVALTVAYRRQHLGEAADRREEAKERREDTKVYNDRFAKAAELLGSEKAAVRLAAVYALSALADDWNDGRQTCIDVLCAYLRMPYTPPDEPAPAEPPVAAGGPTLRGKLRARMRRPTPPAPEPAATGDDDRERREQRQVRHTVIRLIPDHLRQPEHPHTWTGHNLDFSGAVLDGADFSGTVFSGGTVSFACARFSGGTVSFACARFSGGTVSFAGARFSEVTVSFAGAQFCGDVVFDDAHFSTGAVLFLGAAQLLDGRLSFSHAQVCGGRILLNGADLAGGRVSFAGAQLSRGTVSFANVKFSRGWLQFRGATFEGAQMCFDGAEFSGATVSFAGANFTGGTVDLSSPGTWAAPPLFPPPQGAELPPGLLLPPGWHAPRDSPRPAVLPWRSLDRRPSSCCCHPAGGRR